MASRFATNISRHISGEPCATRVKSLNPDPAVSSFNSTSGAPLYTGTNEYTSDGGAGGVELLDWYEGHPEPFWMYLSYDKYSNFKTDEEITDASFGHLAQYNQIIQVYFSNFNYSVVKRGGNNLDLWNISVSLEEV